MAAIQGFALSRGRLVVPVPTLDAIATGWLAQAPPAQATMVVACVDGQRGEVFAAGWRVDAGGTFADATPTITPRVVRPDVLAVELRRPAGSIPTIVIGDGARRYAGAIESANLLIRVADTPVVLAETAARVAAADPSRAVAPHALRPIYLRRPDAELARDRAQATAVPAEPTASLTGFTIARASLPGDVQAVESLQRQTFSNPWAAEAIGWELEHTDVARLYVMRAADAAVVAYCACWIIFDELHINSLAVGDAFRRRGLARHLLIAVLREAASAGAKSATLEVRRSNEAARALYEGLGFHVDAVRRDYYQQPREDALILWHRHLTPDLGRRS